LYANVSQAYRPYLYAYITPADQLGEIDPNLKDTQGYDIDLGYRGQLNELLSFDVNGYFMFYGDRIGNRAVTDPSDTYLLTTNIGDARVSGIEAYANLSLFQALGGRAGETDVRLFSSLAYTHARYANGDIAIGGENLSLKGKHVENVPDWIERAGLEFKRKGFSTTLQASYVSNQFSDATNAPSSPSGIIGGIPAYTVWDLAFDWSFMKQYHVSGGINNLANVAYFSRRIAMYPGPGILPADGRTFYLTVGCKL
jgi:Fe(3+) dicitrate transport protein